jgi:hypothetical protein
MIISASRRTDIPAFYSEWLINRIRAGFCTVPNPFNSNAISVVALRPEDVSCFVFCTRNPRPLMRHLPEVDALGHRYYFQFTLVANPRAIDPHSPPRAAAINTFRKLADRVGSGRMVWRYDPITLTELTPPDYHRRNFEEIARALQGSTFRCVVSLLDPYRKIDKRAAALARSGVHLTYRPQMPEKALGELLTDLAAMAAAHNMEIVSCAEEPGLERYGIAPGKCIDDALLHREWGLQVQAGKNVAMRDTCRCVMSRDIGMYDACLFGCAYCYATTSFDRARANHDSHDPRSPSLLGWAEPPAGWDQQLALFK